MTERQQMLKEIQEVSFAVVDITLYLDTHPTDAAALAYFRSMRDKRLQLLEEYAEKYGPLLVDSVQNNTYWDWIDKPFPWEREAYYVEL